ncbi:uncharacterized protein LOC143195493 isoform X2 [Rhynchophorus ferrugineus]|uniref:uncharacterized protein LOC143195493 isoform X2 n=1 Tax=Rhynchophorus ferrugineus TaxID=354439 RepID=UPI003FCC316C
METPVQQSSPRAVQKAKNMCRFTRELDKKLIELVSQNEVLYDTNHKNYKDLNVRDDVWLAISTMVGKSVQDCKTRWRSLRDLYHRKKKDLKMGKKIRTAWEYMDNMDFMEGFTTERRQILDEDEEVSDEEGNFKIEIKEEFDNSMPACSFSRQEEMVSPPKRQRADDSHCNNCDNTASLDLLKEVRELTNLRNNPIRSFFDCMAMTVMRFPAAQAAEKRPVTIPRNSSSSTNFHSPSLTRY